MKKQTTEEWKKQKADAAVAASPDTVRTEAILFLLTLLLVYLACPIINSGDSRFVIPTALNIVRHGNASIDVYSQQFREVAWAVWKDGGHSRNVYPIGVPWMVVPFVWIADRVAAMFHVDLEAAMLQTPALTLELFLASLVTAAAATTMFVFARRRLSLPRSLLVGVSFALGTAALSSASRGLWQHGPSMLLLGVAILLYDRLPESGWRAALALGFVAGYSYSVRPSNLILIAGFAVAVGITARPRLVPYICGAVISILPFFIFNLAVHGTWSTFYYRMTQRVLFAGPHLHADRLLGFLFSPSRGLFVFSPFLLFVALRFRPSTLRRTPLTALDVLVSSLALAWIWGTSRWPDWWGGGSIGPRLLCDLLPCLIVLLIPVVGEISLQHRVPLTCAFVLTVGPSVWIHLRCATTPAVANWNATPVTVGESPDRLWSWRDPQFLRGFIR